MPRFTGLLGLITFLALAYVFSTNRRAIRLAHRSLGSRASRSSSPSSSSSGPTVRPSSRLSPVSSPASSDTPSTAHPSSSGALGDPKSAVSVFAFAVLPTIIAQIGVLRFILYHIGLLQADLHQGHRLDLIQRTIGTSGAESTNVAFFTSIFMGQTEKLPSPSRRFLYRFATNSELMTIMTSGMAHVSGGIMAAYILFGNNAKDLLSADIMTAPGTHPRSKNARPRSKKFPPPRAPSTCTSQRRAQKRKLHRRHRPRHHRRQPANSSARRHHAHQLRRRRRPLQGDLAGLFEHPLGSRPHPLPHSSPQRHPRRSRGPRSLASSASPGATPTSSATSPVPAP